jgi:hypothetical protein
LPVKVSMMPFRSIKYPQLMHSSPQSLNQLP